MNTKERYKEYHTKFPEQDGERGCFHYMKEIVLDERIFILIDSHFTNENEMERNDIPCVFFHAKCFKEYVGNEYLTSSRP